MVARSIRHRSRDDRGFSLAELLVVIAIMGIVLGGAYSLAFVMQRSASVSDTQAAFASEIGVTLQLSEIYLQQNSSLEAWEDNRLVCFVDRDLDGLVERVTIEADEDGLIVIDVWNTDLQRNNTTQRINFTTTENCVNRTNGTPLFTYYDSSGDEITTLEARASDTRSVKMTVEIQVDGKTMTDDRLVYFRNRR